MNNISPDKTNTKTFETAGKCPFGSDRIDGAEGTPPSLSDWYPSLLSRPAPWRGRSGPWARSS